MFEFAAAEDMVPFESFAIDDDFATLAVAPVDKLTVNVESGGAGNIDVFTDGHVKTDFLGNVFGSKVLVEFREVALTVGDFGEIFVK